MWKKGQQRLTCLACNDVSFIGCSVSSLAFFVSSSLLELLWKEDIAITEGLYFVFFKIACKWSEIFSTVSQAESFSAFCVVDYDPALLFKMKIKSTIDLPQSNFFTWPAVFLRGLPVVCLGFDIVLPLD